MTRDSLRSLAYTSPAPLTRRQWSMFGVAAVAAAITRFVTMARTPWDWDEFLFMFAVERFDISRHHPHPPGFPLFIAFAKLIRVLGFDNFHALQMMNVAAAIAIVPVMFFLCRELRMPFATSLSAGLLLAFFPNVWFFGGTALSDVPSMTLVVLAVALLVAGCRDSRYYLAGAALLAVAGGFRLQNLLIGLVPLAVASWFQIRRGVGRVVGAAVVIAVIIGASYGAAAWLTGWDSYQELIRQHGQYITQTDSFRAPHRAALWTVFEDFFLRPYHAPVINTIVTIFAVVSMAISLVKMRAHVLLALAAFVPFCVFAWLMLDHLSAGRFSIGYAPLIALLAADGIRLTMRRDAVEAAVAAFVLIVMIAWSWPAFENLHSAASPSAAAAIWIRDHADPRTSVVDAGESMGPAAEWYLPAYRRVPPGEVSLAAPQTYELREGRPHDAAAVTFTHPRDRLWNVVRRRYFEVFVVQRTGRVP
ncbi:MAG: hypothetical protein QOC81_3237 [Thermoanaerobaculia bacterium]|jgi:hypothetical protein|nr:hypothetical protein [Thermoanaerobaculia bacterium]